MWYIGRKGNQLGLAYCRHLKNKVEQMNLFWSWMSIFAKLGYSLPLGAHLLKIDRELLSTVEVWWTPVYTAQHNNLQGVGFKKFFKNWFEFWHCGKMSDTDAEVYWTHTFQPSQCRLWKNQPILYVCNCKSNLGKSYWSHTDHLNHLHAHSNHFEWCFFECTVKKRNLAENCCIIYVNTAFKHYLFIKVYITAV